MNESLSSILHSHSSCKFREVNLPKFAHFFRCSLHAFLIISCSENIQGQQRQPKSDLFKSHICISNDFVGLEQNRIFPYGFEPFIKLYLFRVHTLSYRSYAQRLVALTFPLPSPKIIGFFYENSERKKDSGKISVNCNWIYPSGGPYANERKP